MELDSSTRSFQSASRTASLQTGSVLELHNGVVLLHSLIERGDISKVRLILQSSLPTELPKILEALDGRPETCHTGDRPLHAASKTGHGRSVAILLDAGADINAKNYNENTPLIQAARSEAIQAVKVLLERDANVFETGELQRNALHWAARRGSTTTLEVLLEPKKHRVQEFVEALDADGSMPIHLAAESGHREAVKMLLEAVRPRYRKIEVAVVRNGKGLAPIHLAARKGHLEITRYLIEEIGVLADDVSGQQSRTSLHLAVEGGHSAVVNYLLEHGVNVEAPESQLHGTALHLACHFGHLELAEMLLSQGKADLFAKTDDAAGYTVLHIAALAGQPKVMPMLAIAGGRDLVESYGDLGQTALHLASRLGHLNVIDTLIRECRAKIDARDDYSGATSLHFAAWVGKIEACKLLMSLGADKQAKDTRGDTALHWAVLNGQLAIATLFITRGFQVSVKDDKLGRTPLHDAAARGYDELVTLLLGRCVFDERDTETGASPLHLAVYFNRKSTVDIFLKNRRIAVKMCQYRDNFKNTPLHWAAICGHADLAEMLILEGKSPIEAKGGHHGRTALAMAAENNNVVCLQRLLDLGADISAKDDHDGSTPLILASINGSVDAVRTLLAAGADPAETDNNGMNSVHRAASHGSLKATESQIRIWKSARYRDKAGIGGTMTIEAAAQAGRCALSESIIGENKDKGSEPTMVKSVASNSVQSTPRTSIQPAIQPVTPIVPEIKLPSPRQLLPSDIHSTVVVLLLNARPDLINAPTMKSHKRTPLHLAAMHGQIVIVKLLLDRGADPEGLDRLSKSPLRLAFERNNFDIVRLFVKMGIKN